MNSPLLNIKSLSVEFSGPDGVGRAVDDVSLHVDAGESVGLVGESGCGKSVTALSVLGLVATPPGRISGGEIFFGGRDLLRADAEALRRIRGNEIAMVFQEPMTALNPVLPIGCQVAEPLRVHKNMLKEEAHAIAVQWLTRVSLPGAGQRFGDLPHQLSGGMRQRVMIAMAMVCQPRLLMADEPTTALDVTIQAQILSLLHTLKTETGASLLLITHDLGVISQMVDRVVVMYAGQVVEEAVVTDLFEAPFHPYTHGLMQAMPRFGSGERRLPEISGMVPAPTAYPPGCRFAPRCPHVFDRCRAEIPGLYKVGGAHTARCWLKHFPEKRGRHAGR